MNHNSYFKKQKPRIVSDLNNQSQREQVKSFSNQKIYSSSENQPKHKIVFNDLNRKHNSKSKRIYMTYNEAEDLSTSLHYKKNKFNTINDQNGLKEKQDEHSLKKTKSHASNYKYSKQQKKLSIQYDKQLYWNANSQYLVTGVKFQYQKYKQMYQQKCNQLKTLQKTLNKSSIQQLKTYVAVLQSESQKIYEKYNKLKSRKELKQILFQDQMKSQEYLQEILTKLQREQDKNKSLKQYNKTIKQENAKVKKQIKLVQKMLIQKQNSQFNAMSKMRRLEKKQTQLKKKIEELQKIVQEQTLNSQKSLKNTIQNIRQIHANQVNSISIKLKKSQNEVQKLSRENTYLKNLLEYWQKNPDQHKIDQNNNKTRTKDQSDIQYKSQSNIQQKQSIIKNQKTIQQAFDQKNNKKNKPSNFTQIQEKSDDNEIVMHVFKIGNKYKKKSAGIKTQNSIKNRRIQYFQIQGLVQLINLRLAFKKVNKNEIKSFFNYQENKFTEEEAQIVNTKQLISQNCNLPSQHLYQRKDLITMKQVYQIFINQPFKLTSDQANILSRYFVQDVIEQFVYTHIDNSIQRSVVESIATNLFSKYLIPTLQTIQKYQTHLQQYKANILNGFKYETKNGVVAKDKFKDIMAGLGLKGDQQMTDYLLSKMSVSSQSLEYLNYNALYA